jgi:type IV pilus assembly protein PilY1
VLTNIVNDSYNVGLAMFVETGNPNNNTDGAYIRYGVRQMSGSPTDATTNRGMLISAISALDQNGDKGNNATYSLARPEIFRYFAGRPQVRPRQGQGGRRRDRLRHRRAPSRR